MNPRIKCLRNQLGSLNIEGMIVSNPINIKYLTGIDAEGELLITRKENIFLTDTRYVEAVNSALTIDSEIIVWDKRGMIREDYENYVEEWDKKYRAAAVKPVEFESGHLCLAQKHKFKNVYSARWEDCVHCQYCYDCHAEAFCLAHSYIDHIDDFRKPLETRKKAFETANHIKPIKKISEYQCPQCGAPLRRRSGPNGVFAGCSRYPACKGSRQVEQCTEQVIIYDKNKLQYGK